MEWSNNHKYNSFNSFKGLTYYQNYKNITAWLEGKAELGPPIECSLDPVFKCNNRCYYCNSQKYLREQKRTGMLSWGDMYELLCFLARWGVKGVCFGGGGESTLNPFLQPIIPICASLGMETSLVTNGSMLYDQHLNEALMSSRWVGISLDACDRETYKKIRGVDMFDKVVDGIKKLVAMKEYRKSRVDIAIKVLVLPQNIAILADICRMAKELGVQDFHIRPVDLERKDYKLATRLNLDMDFINEQFALCHDEETDTFHVYTVMHKYDQDFHVKHDFRKCLASPLVIQVCTDGNCYVCVDHRIEERFKLGSMEDIGQWWGSDSHRDLVQSINPLTECSRCTWSEYNKQIEEVVQNDGMCVAFP